jgi:hypothetical protein
VDDYSRQHVEPILPFTEEPGSIDLERRISPWEEFNCFDDRTEEVAGSSPASSIDESSAKWQILMPILI